MGTQTGRGFRVVISLLLAGIFVELFVLIGFVLKRHHPSGNLAVVDVVGTIDASRAIVRDLKDYTEDEDVQAIVLRVDSPGGTVGASQEIHDAVLKAAGKKPVVASMGDMAASGGYYVAAPATKIVANPATLTGSIGVIAYHIDIGELLKKANLRWEVLKAGELKDLS